MNHLRAVFVQCRDGQVCNSHIGFNYLEFTSRSISVFTLFSRESVWPLNASGFGDWYAKRSPMATIARTIHLCTGLEWQPGGPDEPGPPVSHSAPTMASPMASGGYGEGMASSSTPVPGPYSPR